MTVLEKVQISPKGHKTTGQVGIPCPFCNAVARTVSVRQQTPNTQHRYMRCTSLECSAVFKVDITVFQVIHKPLEPLPPLEPTQQFIAQTPEN